MKTSLQQVMILCVLGYMTLNSGCREDERGRNDSQAGDGTDSVVDTGTDRTDTNSVGTDSDSNASSSDSSGDTGADSDTEPEVCDEQHFEITGRIVDMLIALDRSESMAQSNLWRPMGDALRQVTAQTEGSVNFGLLTFPFTNEECSPGDILLDVAPNNAAAIGAVVGGGADDVRTAYGTPTAESLRVAKTYLDSIDDGHDKFVLLATDGAPNCNSNLDATTCRCSVGGSCMENWWCLDDADTTAAAAELSNAGYPVYVLGIGDSMQWEDVMNSIAAAGGTGEYIPADSSQFTDVLMDIVGGILSCDFDVDWSTLSDDVNRDPDKVNLYCKQTAEEPTNNDLATGNVIPQNSGCANGANGWSWTDDTATTIHMCDETCEAIKNNACPIISATFGCASIPVLK